jgi:hypothetical protein
MAALLRTDHERGPLVAAGLVTLAVAVYMIDIRFNTDWSAGGRLVVSGLPALLALGVAYFAPREDVPPPWLPAILVVEFALVLLALGNLADALGANGEFSSSGSLTWVGLLVTILALVSSQRHNSAVMALLAGLAGTVTLLAGVDWIFDLGSPLRTFRWLLMLAAILLGAGGMAVRSTRPRHGVALINAAGLVTLGLALTFAIGAIASPFGNGATAGWGWELFVLLVGAGLVAFAISNREPGPGYLGAVNLLAFVLMAANSGKSASLVGWPLWLLLVAIAILAIGLRSRPGPARAAAAPPAA